MARRALTAPHVLREYAVLADGERGALIGPGGDIGWLCAPRWHSPSVFSSLIGGDGQYRVTPVGRYVWGGYYEAGSLVWHSRWVTETGIVECREALAYPADPHRVVLLRSVHAVDGPARIEVELAPRGDYDRATLRDVHSGHGVWTGRCGNLNLRWQSGPGARHRAGTLDLTVDLPAGGRHDLVLELGDHTLPATPPDANTAWRATAATWDARASAPADVLAPRAVSHSLAVLHGLTSGAGGMVAAATTSLPERSEAGRNYDYRYAWIRDQCYAGRAAAAVGADGLLDACVGFISARLHEFGPALAPAYTVDGDPVPAERRLDLPGYPGGGNRIGNHAAEQFQLDALGEVLLLLALASDAGRIDSDGTRAAAVAADAVAARWREPDAGIWELSPRPWTHSRLIASAGLRAAAAAGIVPQPADALALADRILADTTGHALHPSGHWQRSPDDPGLDAGLLLAGLRGATPVDDPRARDTLAAYRRDLTLDGYAYRFRHDDRPLPDAEGSFTLCGFLVALALQAEGDPVEARAWFERTRSASGPPELFTEEYDGRQHQLRGNLPQAFVHALMVETAARLAR